MPKKRKASTLRISDSRAGQSHNIDDDNSSRRAGDLNYSSALATQLAKHFGLESAKKACVENRWDAVLSALQGRRPGQG